MAEAFAKKHGGDLVMVESAGLEPGILNPYVVEAMKEVGIDISENKTKAVFDLFKEGRMYNYVIAVCDKEAAERCPIFPGVREIIHWPFEDPSKFEGDKEEIMKKVRKIRDEIEEKVVAFLKSHLTDK